VLGGAVGAVVLIVVLLLVLSGGGSPKQAEPAGGRGAASSGAASAPSDGRAEEEKRALRLAQADSDLRELRAEEAANPRAFWYLRARYSNLAYAYQDLKEFAAKANERLEALTELHQKEAQNTLEFLREERRKRTGADEEGGYQSAVALFVKMPTELEGLPELEAQFQELQAETETLAQQEAYLASLKREAMAYARRDQLRVATLIVQEGFSEKDFGETPIFARREKILREFQAAGLVAMLEAEDKADRERRESERVARERANKERQDSYVATKGKTPAEPLLGPHDLINWPIRHWGHPWDLSNDGGRATLTVKVGSGGGNVWLGPNGYYWEDYALAFKLKVAAGKVVFYPRAVTGRPSRALTRQPPELSRFRETIVFDAATVGSDWVDVSLDVYGAGDDSVIALAVGGSEKKRFQGKDLTAEGAGEPFPDNGSFLFYFWEGSEVQVADVQLKLVRHRRQGILDT
jgi:hypothetical protein